MSRYINKENIILTIMMFIVVAYFTYPLLSSSKLFYQGDIINSDVTELNFPSRYLLSNYLKKGKLPLWNRYVGNGFPQLAEVQPGILYPFNLILFLAFSPARAFNLSIIVSLFMALVFSYLLFRQYGISRMGSLFSAIAFSFSAFVTAKIKFSYMLNSICWIPLAIYGVERSFIKRNFVYLGFVTVSLSMQLLAGGPQIVFITATVIFYIFVWRLASQVADKHWWKNRSYKMLIIPIASFFLSCLLAAAFSAPQLIPAVKMNTFSTRVMGGTKEWCLNMPIRPRDLVLFVFPFLHGNPARNTYNLTNSMYWENVGYSGLIVLVCALVGVLFLRKKNRSIYMWMVLGIFTLLISMGEYTPIAPILWRYLPGFRLFRFWQRYLIITVLSVAYMGGTGFDFIISKFKKAKLQKYLIALTMIAILLFELGYFAYNQYTTIDVDRMLSENKTALWLKRNMDDNPNTAKRIECVGQRELWKESMKQGKGWLGDKKALYAFMESMCPSHNVLFGLESMNQYGEYGIYRHKILEYFLYMYESKKGWKADITKTLVNILAMSSVRYIVTPFELEMEGLVERESWESYLRGVKIRIYEIVDAFPLARIVQKYKISEYGEYLRYVNIMESLKDIEALKSLVILEEEPKIDFETGEGGEASITYRDDTRTILDVDSPGGGILVLNDTYYPEWHVYVDGEERELLRVNFNFMGVEIEPGIHKVEFKYCPDSFYYGIVIAIAASLLTVLIIIYLRRNKDLLNV